MIESFSGLPSIADLAQPELRLAGLRFNPRTNGPSRGRYITSLMLQALSERRGEADFRNAARPRRSVSPPGRPDARHVSFVHASDNPTDAGLSLWIVDVASAEAHRVPGVALNGIFGPAPAIGPATMPALFARPCRKPEVPRRSAAKFPPAPSSRKIWAASRPAPPMKDLLKNPEDERIFDYYATSQIQIVHLDGTSKPIGEPGVIESASPSPDAHYVLIDERHHPYSYLLPFGMFPERVLAINLGTGVQQAAGRQAARRYDPEHSRRRRSGSS